MERLIFLHTILIWITSTINEFSSKYIFFFPNWAYHSELETSYPRSSLLQVTKKSDIVTRVHTDRDQKTTLMSREDLEMILTSMKLSGGGGGGGSSSSSSLEFFSDLFEEDEPSFEELKESFSVFDRNGDGFIDESSMDFLIEHGFADDDRAVLELETCREMIRNYDRDRDGKIDFMEFVKLMEISFC